MAQFAAFWIPAFAGMTGEGQESLTRFAALWIPAFAGMTGENTGMTGGERGNDGGERGNGGRKSQRPRYPPPITPSSASSSARWQLAKWLGAISRSSGVSVRQTSVAYWHLGLK